MNLSPRSLLSTWCRLSLAEDLLEGEPRFPHRNWLFRHQASTMTFYGQMWAQHEESMAELYAWVSGHAGGPIVLAGASHDCSWLEDLGPEIESKMRQEWVARDIPGLKLPPYDSSGTVGWSLAVEAATAVGPWRDTTEHDQNLAQLRYILEGTLGDCIDDPGRMAVHFFRSAVRGRSELGEAVTRVLAGMDLSEQDERTLAVQVSEERVRELRELSGYDYWR